VRASAPAALTEPLRHVVAALDGDLPVANLRTVEQAVGDARHNFLVVNRLLGAFAALGLLLAAVGLYGVISGLVAQRTQEFGVRLALGAQARDVLWIVLGKGALLAAFGALLGLAGAVGLSRLLGAIIPGLPGHDPLSLALGAGLLLIVTLTACYLPARRAMRIDPMIAIRHE
jgi:putative ABC transport system permease protein